MKITFLGTSCMVPTKERNHQALFVAMEKDGLLVDCGEGTQRQLKLASIRPGRITKILITHWHGDHVLGLPGLLQTLSASDYENTMEIYGPKGTKKHFEYLFKAFAFSVDFEYSIKELGNDTVDMGYFFLESRKLKHGIPCIGYSIREKDKRRIRLNYVKKLGIPEGPQLGELQDGKSIEWKGKTIYPKDATYVVHGKKLAVVMDTLPSNGAYDLAKDADLLIGEAVYTKELAEKAEEYMHMTASQTAQLASQSNVKKLILTHFSQRFKSTDMLVDEAKAIFPETSASYDLMKVSV